MTKTSHPILRHIGARIRSLRTERSLSQEALADRAAIDRSYMSGIERGLRNVSVLHAMRIANALEVSLSDLLRLQPEAARLLAASHWMDRLVEGAVKGDAEADRTDVSDWVVGRYLSLG